MALKKSELYSSIWKSCDELRGGMDASQYKDYVLALLFVKYVSDKYAGQPDALLEVPEGASFEDMVALKGKDKIGEGINAIIRKIAEANELTGITFADFDDPEKLGKPSEQKDKLSKLIGIFQTLDFTRNRADGDDLLGDAYEYLMRNFATQSGKSKGQFYTPAEVSRIMAKVIGVAQATSAKQSIYDPACGSGSLLLKAADEAKEAKDITLSIYGQENDLATSGLAKMNTILHGFPGADIRKENTLSNPLFTNPKTGQLETFDFVVANPPFSVKAWTTGFNPTEDVYHRFELGVPPPKNGDYAFLLHMLASMKSTGKGAVILPHGVLFRGGAEASIRRKLIDRGYIQGIIGLPANLFYGTGIPACILVLDKANASSRQGIFMIDASKGFIKDGPKNRLREQDIHRIVDAFTKQEEVERYARMVPLAEIKSEKHDYNLNLPRYIDSSEPEDLQDITAHLQGGIPARDIDALAPYWQALPTTREALLEPMPGRPGYMQLKVPATELKATLEQHPDFHAFTATVQQRFSAWRTEALPLLQGVTIGSRPKLLIHQLGESILQHFTGLPLLDPYEVYQGLMSYWAETMQDDVYQIVQEGWKPILGKEPNTDLLPHSLMVAVYFPADQAKLEEREVARDDLTRQLEEMEEEHGDDEGALNDARNDKDKITAKAAKEQMKTTTDADDRRVLEDYLALADKEADASRALKQATKALETKVLAHYAKLTPTEVQRVVIEEKWLGHMQADVQAKLAPVGQLLTGHIRQLAERYELPLHSLVELTSRHSNSFDKLVNNF